MIEVVDKGMGRSAAGTVTLSGFEQMVADVCLGKIGAVAAFATAHGKRTGLDETDCSCCTV